MRTSDSQLILTGSGIEHPHAAEIGVERGRRVRIDATVTETNIHEPRDSSLLFDGIRVLTRFLGEARERFGFTPWSDHTKRAKRRMLDAQRTRSRTARARAYEDLLKVTRWCLEYGDRAVAYLGDSTGGNGARAVALRGEIGYYAGLLRRVIWQTERRIFEGESVPAEDKVVSLFEPHTDIIRCTSPALARASICALGRVCKELAGYRYAWVVIFLLPRFERGTTYLAAVVPA